MMNKYTFIIGVVAVLVLGATSLLLSQTTYATTKTAPPSEVVLPDDNGNCPPGYHTELIAQDFTCVLDEENTAITKIPLPGPEGVARGPAIKP